MKSILRLFLICAALAPGSWTQSTGNVAVTTLADLVGNGAAHQLQTSGTARWVVFVCPSTNSAAVRIGDSAVTTSRGVPCAAGGTFMLPVIAPAPGMKSQDQYYSLSTIYYLAQTGDVVSVLWGK